MYGTSGHWETIEQGDGSTAVWIEDPAPAPIAPGFQVIAADGMGRDINGELITGYVETNDVGGYLTDEIWRQVGYAGPLRENYGSGSGDSSDVRTSSELLAFMRDGGYQLGQGKEDGLTVDQLFKGTERIGDPHKFHYEDDAFTVAAVAVGAVAAWAAAGAAAAGGAGAGAAADSAVGIVAADAGAYAAEVAAAEALAAGELGAGIVAGGTAAEAYAAQIAAAESFAAGAAPAWSASSLGSIASGASSIVDTLGNVAGAALKAAGTVLAPVAAKVLGEKLDKEFAPDTPTAGVTYQPFSQAAPGAQLLPLLLIGGAVVLAFVALRKR
jgi:hypothetical protein